MELRDEELKKLMNDSMESPSFGFATKTLRLIQEKQADLAQRKELIFSRWIMGGVLSFLSICMLLSLRLEQKFANINWQIPNSGFELHSVVLMACLFLALGLWVFILVDKNQKKTNHMG